MSYETIIRPYSRSVDVAYLSFGSFFEESKQSYQILIYTDDMARCITIKPYLSVEELETRYRKAKDAVERSHWQMVWLLARGKSTHEVAEITGYCLHWIPILVRRSNQQGPPAMVDHRHTHPGAVPILSAQQQAQLEQALDTPPADGGLCTGRKVAQWIESGTGRQVRPQRGWEYLKRLQFSKRLLRPRHAKADPAAPSGV